MLPVWCADTGETVAQGWVGIVDDSTGVEIDSLCARGNHDRACWSLGRATEWSQSRNSQASRDRTAQRFDARVMLCFPRWCVGRTPTCVHESGCDDVGFGRDTRRVSTGPDPGT